MISNPQSRALHPRLRLCRILSIVLCRCDARHSTPTSVRATITHAQHLVFRHWMDTVADAIEARSFRPKLMTPTKLPRSSRLPAGSCDRCAGLLRRSYHLVALGLPPILPGFIPFRSTARSTSVAASQLSCEERKLRHIGSSDKLLIAASACQSRRTRRHCSSPRQPQASTDHGWVARRFHLVRSRKNSIIAASQKYRLRVSVSSSSTLWRRRSVACFGILYPALVIRLGFTRKAVVGSSLSLQ